MNSIDNSQRRSLIGQHAVADLHVSDAAALSDASHLMNMMRTSLLDSGFNILCEKSYQFGAPGFGATGFFLLSESHAAFHSYPEYGFILVDVFSCGSADPHAVVAELESRLCARSSLSLIERGRMEIPALCGWAGGGAWPQPPEAGGGMDGRTDAKVARVASHLIRT